MFMIIKKLLLVLLSLLMCTQALAGNYVYGRQTHANILANNAPSGKGKRLPSATAKPLVVRAQSGAPASVEIDANKFSAIANDRTSYDYIVITATLRDAGGVPVSFADITWKADKAVIATPQSGQTNALGQVSVQLSSFEALTTALKLIVNNQLEFDTGTVITFSRPGFGQVHGSGLTISSDQLIEEDILVTGTFEIAGTAVVTLVGQRLIQATNVVIGPQARLSADGTGHGGGRGASAGWPKQESATGGGGHGGHGGQGSLHPSDNDPSWPGAPYGSIGQPERMGSSGGVRAGNLTCPGHGGGAVKIVAAQAITIEGTISANGSHAQPGSACGGGAGGSVWLTAARYAGYGTVTANGGDGDVTTDDGVDLRGGGGGGGRVALHGLSGQPPQYSIQAAPGANGLYAAEPGTALYIAPIDQFSSGLELERDVLYVDTYDTALITVTLRTADGEPIAGRPIVMKVTPASEGTWLDNQEAGWWNGGEVSVGSTDEQGQRAVAIRSNQIGTVSITARTLDGVVLAPDLRVTFTTNQVTTLRSDGIVASGWAHICAITAVGALYCWGMNDTGQVGDGTVTAWRTAPVAVTNMGSGVTAVSAGWFYTCAIKDGALYCWGDNAYGQLGDGTTAQRSVPVAVQGMDSGVTSVVAGEQHTCAVKDEALYCWGRNDYGQLGDGTLTSRFTPVAVQGMEAGVTAAAAGEYHTCAIKSGALYCWGWNGYGQLGDGTQIDRLTPVAVNSMARHVTAVAASRSERNGNTAHTCAIKGGALYCWGANVARQLGDGTLTNRLTPVAVQGMDSGVTSVAVGEYHTCAIKGGAIYCWGDDSWQALGNGEGRLSSSVPSAVLAPMTSNVTALAAGGWNGLGLRTDGCLYYWGWPFGMALGSSLEGTPLPVVGECAWGQPFPPSGLLFGKAAPMSGTTGLPVTTTLSWNVPLTGTVDHYRYCYETAPDCTAETRVPGDTTSVVISGLLPGATYYWQVRACATDDCGYPTDANGSSGHWSFVVKPLPTQSGFNKQAPTNGATDISINPILSWTSSADATRYEVCYDTALNGACDATWQSVGSTLSTTLIRPAAGVEHEWQVRACDDDVGCNAGADGGAWWSFKVRGVSATVSPNVFYLGETATYLLEDLSPSQVVVLTAQYPGLIWSPDSLEVPWVSGATLTATSSGAVEVTIGAAAPGTITLTAVSGSSVIAVTTATVAAGPVTSVQVDAFPRLALANGEDTLALTVTVLGGSPAQGLPARTVVITPSDGLIVSPTVAETDPSGVIVAQLRASQVLTAAARLTVTVLPGLLEDTLTEDVSADVLFVVPSTNGVSAVSSTVVGGATSAYANGTQMPIHVWVRDVSGRPAPYRPVDLIVQPDPSTGTGYQRIAGVLTDPSDGKATFLFGHSYTGTYTLWGIVHEVGFSTPITIPQPFTVTLRSGPALSSLSRLHAHQPAFAGESGVTVTLVLTDAAGRRVQGAQTKLSNPDNSVTITPALAFTNQDGEASFLVKRSSSGNAVISGNFKQPLDPQGNWQSLQSDLSLTFLSPLADPRESYLQVQPTLAQVPADGQSSITVNLHLRDRFNYPVLHDKPVVFTYSAGSPVVMNVPGGLVTATNGIASINLRSSVPQTVVVSAWLPDEQVTVTQRVTVEFAAFNTDPDLSSITVERPVGFASPDRPLAITVTLRDSQGRIVPLNNVSLVADGSNVSVSNDSFQMRWRVSTTQAQTITLRAVDTTVGVTLTQAPTISFVPGPVSNLSLSSVNPNQVAADGYQTSTAIAVLRDSLGRPLAGYPVRLIASSLDGDNSAVLFVAPSFTQLSDANGQVTFHLSATQPGRWSITLLDLVNQDLGYPALTLPFPHNVIFYGRLDSAATTLQASRNPALAYGHEAVTLTLQLRDSAGSAVPGVPITFTTATEGVTLTQVALTSNSQGIVQARISKHTPGNAVISAVLPNGEVLKQISITFYSPLLWRPYSQITIPNPVAVANGEDRVAIQAVLRGLDGAPVAGRLMRLIASGGRVTFPDGSVRTTNAQGEISFTVASTRAESKFLQIEDTLSGDSIPIGHAVFEPSTLSVSRSHVLVEDTLGTGEVRLTVILRDAHDNPIPNQRVRIESTRPVSIVAPTRSSSGGTLVASITSNAVQTTSLSVYVEDVLLSNHAVRLKGVSSAHSRLTASAPVITADGISTLVLTAELRSSTGEPLVDMPVRLEILSSGRSADFAFQISPSHQLRTDSSGVARFFVNTARAGTAEVILKDDILRNVTIAKTTVAFTPGAPHPTLSSFHLPGGGTRVVREWLDAEVTLRDRYGNLVTGRPVSIQIEGRDLQFASQKDVQILDGYYVMTATTSQDGKATFSFSSPTVQRITMTAWYGGQRIGRVLSSAFLNAPDPNLSVLEVGTPGQATADGQSAISVTLRLFDANGYPIVGLPIRPALLNLPQDAYRVQPLPIITTGSDGSARFSVTSIRAGVFPLQVRDDAYDRLVAQGTLTYTAGAISLAASQLTVSPPFPQPADGLTPYKVTVVARDDNGNPLEGVSVQVQAVPQQGIVITQPQGLTDASGRASAYIVGTTRAPISLTASVDGRLISATAQVRFYSSDLRVASASIHPLHFGGKAIYGIEVANSDVLAARQAYLEVTLDPRLSYVDQSSTAAFTRTGGVLRWSFGDLPEGQTRFVRLVLDASQAELGDTLLVTSSVGALNGDEDDSDNTAVASATVAPHRDFEAALREPAKFVGGGEGSTAVYALLITNTGASMDVFTVHAKLKDTHNSLGLISVVTPANGFSVSVRAGEAVLLPVVLRLNGCEREGEHTFEVAVSSSDGKVRKVDGSLALLSQPSLVDLHPGDGFVAVGGEAVFTWATHSADAQGALIIERMDSTGFGGVYSSTVTPIEGGLLRHTAVVSNLAEGALYRWRVQLIGACASTESAPSSLRMERAVVLGGPARVEIERDYNQPIAFVLTNRAAMPRLVSVTVEALNGADEFILGFVGSGSPDQAVVLAPGASRAITLMLHAQHATSPDYKVLLRASSRPYQSSGAGAFLNTLQAQQTHNLLQANFGSYQSPDTWASFNTLLDIRVRQPVISYTLAESYNPNTMIWTYRLTNHGSPLTDLRMDAKSQSDGVNWLTYPTLQNAYLGTGQSITVEVVPVIETDEITSAVAAAATMKGKIELSAAGTTLQEVALPPSLPPTGQSLFRARIDGGLRIEAASADYYCTNRPNITLRLDTPGLNSNYSDHELKLNFRPRSNVRPHDSFVSLNKFPVLSLVRSVPAGEYREKVSPLFISSSGVQNVQIKTRHMNGGHYVVASGVRLVSCADSFERWVYAGSQAEADAAARSLSFVNPSSGGSGRFQIQQLVRGDEVHEGDAVRVVARLIGDPLPTESKVYLRATGAQLDELIEMERQGGHSSDSEYVAVVGPILGAGPLKLTVGAEACNYQSDSVLLSVVPPSEPGEAHLLNGSTFEVAPKIVLPDGRSKATITLTLRSESDNSIIPDAKVWLYNKPLSPEEGSPALGEVLSVTGRTNAQGQFTASMTSTIAGEFYITADDLDRQVELGRGILVRFDSPGVIRTSPRSVRSNGRDLITITVRTVEHASSMSGTVIQLSTESGSVGRITPPVVVLDSSGVATAVITSTEPGSAVIRAMAVITDEGLVDPERVISATTVTTRENEMLVDFARSQKVYFGDGRQLVSLSAYPTLVEVSQTIAITLAAEVPDVTSTSAVITTSRPSADRLSTTQGQFGYGNPLAAILSSSLPGESVVTAHYVDPVDELTRTVTKTVTFASSLRVLSLTLSPSPTIYLAGQSVSVTGQITGSDLHLYDKLRLIFVVAPITPSERFSSPENFDFALRAADVETEIKPDGRFSFNFTFRGLRDGYVATGALYATLPLERNRAGSPVSVKLLHLLQGDIVVTRQRPTAIASVRLNGRTITRTPSMQAWFAAVGRPITITTRSVIGTAPYTNHPSVGLPVSAFLEHAEGGSRVDSVPMTTDVNGRVTITFTPVLTGLHYFKLKHLVPLHRGLSDTHNLLLADRVYVAPEGSTCLGLPAITSYTSNYKFTRDAIYPAIPPGIFTPTGDPLTFTLRVDWKGCKPGKVVLGLTAPFVTPKLLEQADSLRLPSLSVFYREYPVLHSRQQITLANTFDPMTFPRGDRYLYIALISEDGMRSNYVLAPHRSTTAKLDDLMLIAAGLSHHSGPVVDLMRGFFATPYEYAFPTLMRDRRKKEAGQPVGSVPGLMYAVIFPHPADKKVGRLIPTLLRMLWPKKGEPPRSLSHLYDRDTVLKEITIGKEGNERIIRRKIKPVQYFEVGVPFVCDGGPYFSFLFMRTLERGGDHRKVEYDLDEFYVDNHSRIKNIPGAKAAYLNLLKGAKEGKVEQSSLKTQLALKFHVSARLGPVFCGNQGQALDQAAFDPFRVALDLGFMKKWGLLPLLVRFVPAIGMPLGGALGFACDTLGIQVACGPEAYAGVFVGVKTKIALPLDALRGGRQVSTQDFMDKFWLGLILLLGVEYSMDKLFYFNAEVSVRPGLEFRIDPDSPTLGVAPSAGVVELEGFVKVAVSNLWAAEYFHLHKFVLRENPEEPQVDFDQEIQQAIDNFGEDGVTISAGMDALGDDADEEGTLDIIPIPPSVAADDQVAGVSPTDVFNVSHMAGVLEEQLAFLSEANPQPPEALDVRNIMTEVMTGRYTLVEALLSMASQAQVRPSAAASPLADFKLIPPTGKGDSTYGRFVASELPAAFSINHPLAVQASLGADTTITSVVVSNVFTYSQPALAADPSSGRVIMVWSHDRSDGPLGGSRELMYSVWDGTEWSTARPVTLDGLSDISPSVVWSANGRVILVWVRAKQLLSDQVDLSPFEIATAEYDPATDTWSDIGLLTKNDSADLFPLVARGEDGTVVLAWTALDASGSRSIQTRLWQGDGRWSPAETAWRNAPSVFDLAHHSDGNSILVGTQRLTLAGLTTETHQVFAVRRSNGVWGQPQRVTQAPVDHYLPSAIYDASGLPVLGWISSDRVHLKRLAGTTEDVATSRAPAEVLAMASPSTFDLLRAPGGNLLALVKDSTPLPGLHVLHLDYSNDRGLSLLGEPKRLNGFLESAVASDAVVDNSGRLLVAYVGLQNQEVTRTLEYSPSKVVTDIVPVRADLMTLAHYVGRRLALRHVRNDRVDFDLTNEGVVVTATVAVRNMGDVVENANGGELRVAFFADNIPVGAVRVATEVLPNTSVLVSHTFVLTSPGQHVVSARLVPDSNILLDPGGVTFAPVFTGISTIYHYLSDLRYLQNAQQLEADIAFENLLPIASTVATAAVTLEQGEVSRTQIITLPPLSPQAKHSVTATFDVMGLVAGQYSLTIALDGQKAKTTLGSLPGDLVIESITTTELSKAPVMIEARIRNNGWLTVSQASLVIADRSQLGDHWRQGEISVPLSALAPQETISLTVLVTRPLICELNLDVRSPLIADVDPSNNTFLMPGIELCFVAGIGNASVPSTTLANYNPWQGVAPFTVYLSNTTNYTLAEWLWDFGDGITDTRRDPISHTYTSPGIYILRLTALDPDSGAQSTASQLVTVYSPTLPIINCLGCDSATTRTTQEFSSDSQGSISDIHWDFGDGTMTRTGSLVYHSYKQPGTYTVTLSVKGLEGDWRQAQMPVVVSSDTSHLTHRAFLPSVGLQARWQPTKRAYLPVVRQGQK